MKHQVPESMKFKRLCRRLGVTPAVAAGTLELLWIATQKEAPRGDIGKFSDEDIAIAVWWEGEPTELVNTLVETGWLDRHPTHRLLVHDWQDHAPRYVHGIVAKMGGFFTTEADSSDGLQSATTVGDVREQQRNLTKPIGAAPLNQTEPNQTQPNPTKAASAACSEPASPPSEPAVAEDPDDPVVMEFPVNGNKSRPLWALRRSKASEYRESFPGVDVRSELLKARQWCRDNPTKRKTAKGMPAFLTTWLSKAQNEAGRNQRGSPPPAHDPRNAVAVNEQTKALIRSGALSPYLDPKQ
jgi:hypothetical protein